MNIGKLTSGHVFNYYAGPSPPPTTGPHTYQILLLQQDKDTPASAFKRVPTGLGNFDVTKFISDNKMCGDHLVGAFEWFSSN
ncbi:hypothetical protein GH877_30580, partial [Bacillus thuringiensis]|nr:hypothetical protein [Bacillus thuringiensis]